MNGEQPGNIFPTYSEGERGSPQVLECLLCLPRPPHGASAVAAFLQCGGPGWSWGGAADFLSMTELLVLLLEALQRCDRGLCVGACGKEVHRVPPAVRVALVVIPLTEARLQLLPQKAHCHLQYVGFLQLGVGLLLVKLFLQNDFELLDAAVDAISAHLLHYRFSQLRKRRHRGQLKIQVSSPTFSSH